jgi:alpha-D-ribose 1-methylphosphonate 5-triphosphate diphosphatase
MDGLRVSGGMVLLADGTMRQEDLLASNGKFELGCSGGGTKAALDARGLLVLPGIVDIHGDAFERQMQPRPGVGFPADVALADTEAQLLANGITTAFHGVTLSWEPGLRGLDAWRTLLDALAARPWTCDMRVHLRWEAFNLEALDTALADIAAGRVHLLAFNDHTPAILKRVGDPLTGAKYSERAGMTLADFQALAERVGAWEARVPAALERIGTAARAAGIPLASHDDASVTMREAFRALGARICEFPIEKVVGQAAREAGDWVVMGSPNVVRGGSHLGWASAAKLAEEGICSVLSSDYYYPAMMRAALILAGRGTLDMARAWALISTNPAAATGLADRGTIATGQRADIVVVDPARPSIVATIAGGRLAHLASEGAARLRLAA